MSGGAGAAPRTDVQMIAASRGPTRYSMTSRSQPRAGKHKLGGDENMVRTS